MPPVHGKAIQITTIDDNTGVPYMTQIEYECEAGSRHVSGNDVRTCQTNRTFDGEPIVCGMWL